MSNLKIPIDAKEWRPIKNYEGLYEISNDGEVRSLPKEWLWNGVTKRTIQERLMKKHIKNGYYYITLCKNSKHRNHYIHHLVWDNFNGRARENLQIDHIDQNRLNNYIANLQLLSSRQNNIKASLNKPSSSKYTGVSWDEKRKKWIATIKINRKSINLGASDKEEEAYQLYLNKLKEIGD